MNYSISEKHKLHDSIENLDTKPIRVAMVAENVSKRMGGEAGNNLYYFLLLCKRQVDVWLVCHGRVKEELRQELDDKDFQKIHFIEDSWLQIIIWRFSQWFPYRVKDLIFGQCLHILTQLQAKGVVKKMIAEKGIQLVFQPTPITPKGLSFMYNLGVPVVIGPLSGGMEFPPAFQYMDSPLTRFSISMGRLLSALMHRVIPGKLQADTLIVANELTVKALPKGYKGNLYQVIDCAVDLSIWKPRPRLEPQANEPVRFVYLGRFVDWKGVQFLVTAFKQVVEQTESVLELIGDGELRSHIAELVTELNIQDYVKFYGWMKPEDSYKLLTECDVMVLPSLRECGGNSLLEAMAMGLPVIATKWGGPANTVDPSCGILVEPSSEQDFINGLAQAMIRLAKSPQLRSSMGEAGPQHITKHYLNWNSKSDRIIEILRETLQTSQSSKRTYLG